MVIDADIGVKMRGIRATVFNKIASHEGGEDYPDLPIPDQEVDRAKAREEWGRRRSGGERIGGDRLRPISTSASFFFRLRPIRLRPISTSPNFDFGQFRLRPIFRC